MAHTHRHLYVLIIVFGLLNGSLGDDAAAPKRRSKRQCFPGSLGCQCNTMDALLGFTSCNYAMPTYVQPSYVQPVPYYPPSYVQPNPVPPAIGNPPVIGAPYTSCDAIITRSDVQDCTQFGSNLYFIVKGNYSWSDACRLCQSIGGGYLATIKNFQEYQILVGFASVSYAGSLWIGGNDLTTEGRYVWMDDNSPMVYNQWLPGFPSNNELLDCMLATSAGLASSANSRPQLAGWIENNVGWADVDCNMPMFPFCEISIGGRPVSPIVG